MGAPRPAAMPGHGVAACSHGQFLDFIAGERLAALFTLRPTAGCGATRCSGSRGRRSTSRRASLMCGRPAAATDRRVRPEFGPSRCPSVVVQALKAWRKLQAADRLAWGRTGRTPVCVFTSEDGTAVPGQWVSVRFETLAFRAGLPPVRFHDLRHGAASLCKAAGLTPNSSQRYSGTPGHPSPMTCTYSVPRGGEGGSRGRRGDRPPRGTSVKLTFTGAIHRSGCLVPCGDQRS